MAITSDAVWKRSLRYSGCSYQRTLAHGGSHGPSSQEASAPRSQGTQTGSDPSIVSSWPGRRYPQMLPSTVFLAMARDRRSEVVAAAVVLDGDVNGLERGANIAGTLPRNAGGSAVVVSQVAVGQKLHGLVRSAVEVPDGAGSRLT